MGPMLLPDPAGGAYVLGAGADPGRGFPLAFVLVAVERTQAGFRRRAGWPVQRRYLDTTPVGDWLTEPLPAWADDFAVTHLAALFVYAGTAQADVPDADAVDAAVDRALAGMDAMADALPPGIVDLGWRQADGAALRLALGSCQYPAGIFDDVPAYAAWQRLVTRCADPRRRPHALILTGDQVYVDATAGLLDPSQRDERYRKPYEHWLHQRHVRDALRRLPVYTMLDDHEIDNDWAPLPQTAPAALRARNAEYRRFGVEAFQRYQRARATTPLWFETRLHEVEVFFADTRSERGCRDSRTAALAPIMDPAQHAALLDWIDRGAQHDRPKLLVAPAAMLPRHRYALCATGGPGTAAAAVQSDGWDGWPASWQAVLARIADSGICGLVLLSGDEHLGLWVQARVQRMQHDIVDRDVRFESVHTAGLYTPYRFANAQRSDFVLADDFAFASADGRYRYRCTLHTRVFEGAGFTFLELARSAGSSWKLRVEYDDGSDAPQRCGEAELS